MPALVDSTVSTCIGNNLYCKTSMSYVYCRCQLFSQGSVWNKYLCGTASWSHEYTVIALWQGHPKDISAKLKQDWKPALYANWKLWIPFQFINFRFIPTHLQVSWIPLKLVSEQQMQLSILAISLFPIISYRISIDGKQVMMKVADQV